jgi:transcription antitermination factor NusG
MTPYADLSVDPLPLPPRPGLTKADWFAFVTAPQREQIAGAALQARGLVVFVPIVRELRRVAGRFSRRKEEAIERPLFTGYLFVRADTALAWLDLLSLNDRNGRRLLHGVVGFDGAPAAIRHEAMARVIELSGQTVDRRLSEPRPVRAGGRVRIVDGAFRSAGEAIVDGLDAKTATIFLELFGARRAVKIPLEHLEAVA